MIIRVIGVTKDLTEMKKGPPRNEMLIFGLRSTSDDWLSNPSNESRLKCGKMSPKSSNNEMLIFGLHSTCDDQLSNLSKKMLTEMQKNEKGP